MELDSLQALYVNNLKDLYSAEKQLLKALPKMAKAASHEELAANFEEHARVTERQVERLERIFADLGQSPRGKKCVGMEGLIDEAEELVQEKPDPEVLDAGLIAKAQHVEHYEIAGYGTVRTYAEQLGLSKHAELLQQTLDEEGEADKRLTALAESSINLEAESGDLEVTKGSGGRASASRSGSRRRGSRATR
jgi:ferritin-like metal-binding protein YciE